MRASIQSRWERELGTSSTDRSWTETRSRIRSAWVYRIPLEAVGGSGFARTRSRAPKRELTRARVIRAWRIVSLSVAFISLTTFPMTEFELAPKEVWPDISRRRCSLAVAASASCFLTDLGGLWLVDVVGEPFVKVLMVVIEVVVLFALFALVSFIWVCFISTVSEADGSITATTSSFSSSIDFWSSC